jgi:hypothetical protein
MQNNQEQQILNEDLKNKRLFFAGAIAFIIIAIAIIGVYIFIKITGPGQDAGEGDDIPPAVFFYNRDQLLNKLDKESYMIYNRYRVAFLYETIFSKNRFHTSRTGS